MTDTTDKFIDQVVDALRCDASITPHKDVAELMSTAADTLHKVRSERNMLAYEKGGHSLWTRYAKEGR